jgi:hypothetical protein
LQPSGTAYGSGSGSSRPLVQASAQPRGPAPRRDHHAAQLYSRGSKSTAPAIAAGPTYGAARLAFRGGFALPCSSHPDPFADRRHVQALALRKKGLEFAKGGTRPERPWLAYLAGGWKNQSHFSSSPGVGTKGRQTYLAPQGAGATPGASSHRRSSCGSGWLERLALAVHPPFRRNRPAQPRV